MPSRLKVEIPVVITFLVLRRMSCYCAMRSFIGLARRYTSLLLGFGSLKWAVPFCFSLMEATNIRLRWSVGTFTFLYQRRIGCCRPSTTRLCLWKSVWGGGYSKDWFYDRSPYTSDFLSPTFHGCSTRENGAIKNNVSCTFLITNGYRTMTWGWQGAQCFRRYDRRPQARSTIRVHQPLFFLILSLNLGAWDLSQKLSWRKI